MILEQTRKKIVHKINKLKYRADTKLTILDTIPTQIRKPLWVIVFISGVIFFFVPIIKGYIIMYIWWRMMTRIPLTFLFRFVGVEKAYLSPREALFLNLK